MEELGLKAPVGKEGFFYADAFGVDPEEGDLDSFEGKTKQEVIDKINDKYDKELADLEGQQPMPQSQAGTGGNAIIQEAEVKKLI